MIKAIIGSKDHFLSLKLGRLAGNAGMRVFRTYELDRIIHELKQPDRIAIIDISQEEFQASGVLRQIVNISRISSNKVICICPNQDEDLKKFARNARPHKVFLRYDLETRLKEYLLTCSVVPEKSEGR